MTAGYVEKIRVACNLAACKQMRSLNLASCCSCGGGGSFAGSSSAGQTPDPELTDGEAANPGPRMRRRGPRSEAARSRRQERHSHVFHAVSALNDMPIDETTMEILQCNIRGWASHSAELTSTIRLLERKPLLVCLNETLLDKPTQELSLEGYALVGRRDRRDGRSGGVVAIFVSSQYESSVAFVKECEDSGGLWCIVHSDHGPVAICAWYRPPAPGELTSIRGLETE